MNKIIELVRLTNDALEITLSQLQESNPEHEELGSHLINYASHVEDEDSYKRFLLYNKYVKLTIKSH